MLHYVVNIYTFAITGAVFHRNRGK